MQDLTKRTKHEHLKALKPGDTWTIFHNGSITVDIEDGRGPRAPEVGEIIGRWYSIDEPGRNFRIIAVHPQAIQTVFLGFRDFADPAP